MEKKTCVFVTYALTVPPIILVCLVLIISGIATPFIKCFAVDSTNRIYVGTQGEISVFLDGEVIDTINPMTSKAYMFTITENDQILLATSTKAYTMTLQGDVLDEVSNYDIYNQLSYKKSKFISKSGDEYKITNQLGRSRIVKNNSEVVYSISILSLTVKVLLVVGVTLLTGFAIWSVKQKIKIVQGNREQLE